MRRSTQKECDNQPSTDDSHLIGRFRSRDQTLGSDWSIPGIHPPSLVLCVLCNLLFLAPSNITNRSGVLKENKQNHFTFNIIPFVKLIYVTFDIKANFLLKRKNNAYM